MKHAFLIASLYILLSGCGQVALTAFATAFLKDATKPYSDEQSDVKAADYDTLPDALEVENIDAIELD